MKLSAGTIGFWANIAISIITAILVVYFFDWLVFVVLASGRNTSSGSEQLRHWIFWGCLIFGLWTGLSGFLQEIKKKFVAALPDSLEVTKANLIDYPKLDRTTFAAYSDVLSSRGFSHTNDFVVTEHLSDGGAREIPGLSRLLINHDTNCYAIIFQALLPSGQPLPVVCTIVTDFGEHGTLINSNYTMDSVGLFWRNEPRDIWFSTPPATPRQLYQDHLDFRSSIELQHNILPLNVSEAEYLESEQQDTKRRKERVIAANIFTGMVKATWFEIKPYYYWLGDYAKSTNLKNKAQEIIATYGLS